LGKKKKEGGKRLIVLKGGGDTFKDTLKTRFAKRKGGELRIHCQRKQILPRGGVAFERGKKKKGDNARSLGGATTASLENLPGKGAFSNFLREGGRLKKIGGPEQPVLQWEGKK